jgi:hypothetical protein
MPYQLSEHARATLLQAARAMFPHDGLPDEAYAGVVAQLEADAGGDPAVAATLEQGVAQLDGLERIDEDALRAHAGEPYFELLKATSVVALYDNPLVWKAFGYEGPAAHLGGYVDRGFDDLDWLPDPPIDLDPAAGSHHR